MILPTFFLEEKKFVLTFKMDVFAIEDSGIDVDREQEAFTTWSTLESNSKKFVKIFDFKCELKRHGFLQDENMEKPRKIYLIEGSYLDYDTKVLEHFTIPLSKNDCVSAENLKVELEKISQAYDGNLHYDPPKSCKY